MSSNEKDVTLLESNATLTYLTNPVYKTTVDKKHTEEDVLQMEANDRKFYRKRIMELTRNMFRGEKIDRDVQNAFDDYVRTCVLHLKIIDTRDILQSDYPIDSMEGAGDVSSNMTHIDIEYATTKTMGRPPNPANVLENFVTRTTVERKEPPPQKKTINLKANNLRTKGVKAKKKKKKI